MCSPASFLIVLAMVSEGAVADAIRTQLVRDNDRWQLVRDGQPYLIKGVGGGASRELLAKIGGNSFRTWGTRNLREQLDVAQRLGLTVTVGLGLPQDGRGGFSYDNAEEVAKHVARACEEVREFKDHPAVLMWAIGNEIEGYGKGDNPNVWKTINRIAREIKQIDPDHPTMTVTAELGGERLSNLLRYCTDVDIYGVNSYGRAASIGERYTAAGGTKPYIVTEFGPPGIWEIKKNEFGQYPEMTSTQKGEVFRRAWNSNVVDHANVCLGAYAFLWGNKQEATSTWFGMLLPDRTRLEAVDVMNELWTGKPPENRVPKIKSIQIDAEQPLKPDQIITARVDAEDPENDEMKFEWVLHSEQTEFKSGGEPEKVTTSFPDAILEPPTNSARVTLPAEPGGYRLFVYIRDGKGGGATANVPLFIR